MARPANVDLCPSRTPSADREGAFHEAHRRDDGREPRDRPRRRQAHPAPVAGRALLVVTRGSSGAQLAAELATGGRTVSHVSADLGSLDSVRSAATEIRDRLDRGDLPPLRGFVGNAGIQYTNALTETPDGFESTFTVNVLANHLFVRLLQDRFTAPARIVITASDTHFGDFKHNMGMVPGPAWKSPDLLARTGAFPEPDTVVAGRTAYSTSKLAAIYLVHEYARRLPAGIDAVAYNPGFVPAPASPATPTPSPGSRCGASCR
ncbi:hypothetical protein GCM10011428_07770 [Streptomyces violaceus]|uniref:SDR family NAD(P)-dependent oxidoreductase n=1 Tax=Streptomyces violaceus TaxID=1936 RepID=UPI0031EDCD13